MQPNFTSGASFVTYVSSSRMTPHLIQLAAACVLCIAPGADAQDIRYTIENLGVLGQDTSSVPTCINNNGDVVGWSSSGQPRAFLYTTAQGMTQLPNLPNRPHNVATAISDSCIIAGYGYIDFSDHPGRAWRIVNGAIEDLGTLGLSSSAAQAVNDAGTVVGYSSCGSFPSAILHDNAGPLIDLTGACAYSYGEGINNSGVVTGYRSTGEGWRAYRWSSGTGFVYLPPLEGFAHAYGFAINNAGQVAGKVRSASGSSERLIRYTGNTVQNLGGTGQDNRAWSINSHGDVVGEGRPNGGLKRAVLYTDQRGLEDLNLLIDPNPPGGGWFLLAARGINDAGQIVCLASNQVTGESRAVRLTPIIVNVPGDVNGDGVVGVPDLLAVIANWGACGRACPPACTADIAPQPNGDCNVGVPDLLMVIANWG